ncbi:hypothetical protein STSP2_00532 [Anaerohalosphaera lusitana]|uniref:RAMA domain-containing protein n=1 Tax=Anaerohalosphaera lusitana TaxID=1936003 RepID=A0A1U9NI11_9BACT|nr:DUF4357 domain-containing protein [Anaerohalosphaera lusitana]AQT67388.1 hypothetical protein STSP2_00532 [Anaerohalosphaera lusitana]
MEKRSGIKTYDVSVSDLIDADLLQVRQKLYFRYAPRGMERKTYKAIVLEDGSITTLGQNFSSLSYAAIACIQDAGSERTTTNGWDAWKTKDGCSMAQVREEYLRVKEQQAEEER